MQHMNRWTFLLLTSTLAASGCGGNYGGTPTATGNGNEQQDGSAKEVQSFFSSSVSPNLDFCRTCHVPEGSADTSAGRRFMLSSDKNEDYSRLQSSWITLGKGVETSPILLNASGAHSHSGGSPWPASSAPYASMKTLLACWSDPEHCAALLGNGDTPSEPYPLLGDLQANGGRNYAAVFCENRDDQTPLPQDPRELIAGKNLNNGNYAVWYNDPFEICETPELFKNQKRQNEILVSQGKKPIYSAKPRPQTCGEWRAAVEAGRQYVMSNPITGAVLTAQSLYNLASYGGFPIPGDAKTANELIAKVSQQRYGWPSHPYDNPFPMPGEDPNKTAGGSLQLPVALVQVKDDAGKWTGKIGVTCFACHVGQIGTGEVVGNSAARDHHPELYGGSKSGLFVSMNGSNTDTGLALYDIDRANATVGMLGFTPTKVNPNTFNANLNTPAYMANRTRGSNAADQEIVNVLLGRDFDSLDLRSPLTGPEMFGKLMPSAPMTGGDQDVPTWWWTHNKSRYLWVGFGSAGSSRANYFPSSTNPNDGHWSKAREGHYQDLDLWLNAIEAPKFVGPAVNKALAEQGAILFHAKNLWAGDGNSDIPKPPVGNGSCASCHGAYSPRYIHQPGYLPDPSLAGMSGATVPLSIIGTDPAQSDTFLSNGFNIGNGAFGGSWMAYPDAQPGYRLPEEKSAMEEAADDFASRKPDANCALRTLGGYTAQPLHGVWASGPYFHNGSVPTLWDVLKPSDRPAVWLRQQVPASEASPKMGDRGFDTQLARAYDYEKMGWKYERLACDARTDASAMSCHYEENVPSALDMFLSYFKTFFKVAADYFSPPYVVAPGEGEVHQRSIYNTHAYSKGNQGHAFTKVLTDQERRALIEYLKTL